MHPSNASRRLRPDAHFTRREAILVSAAALLQAPLAAAGAEPATERKPMGVVIHSYGIRGGVAAAPGEPPFGDPIRFVEFCHQRGAGGVQVSIGAKDKDYVARLRGTVEKLGSYLEGSIWLPQSRDDVARFTAEVRTAKEAGATVLRTAILGGRRYETFDTAESFRKFTERAYESVGLAEPVVAKHDMRLAIENHKDWRIEELLAIIRRASNRHIGICVDTGNSIALLEDPLETVEAFAPFAFTTHIKDMGVREFDEGFLLSEVPLGTGFLDLKRICALLSKAQPGIRFNLEMITRDPLRVPCLAGKYWATFDQLPGRQLAAMLALVRKHASPAPLPVTTELSQEAKLDLEDTHVRRCLAYAREHL